MHRFFTPVVQRRMKLGPVVSTALALIAAGTACGRAVGPPNPPPSAGEKAAPVVHEDYASLLPFRSYTRVLRVGEDEHHYDVWFRSRASWPVLAHIAVSADSSSAHFENIGLFALSSASAAPPRDASPATPSASTERAISLLRERFGHIDPLLIEHVGRYRAIDLVEYVPLDNPSPSATRSGTSAIVTLTASADLGHFVPPFTRGLTTARQGLLCTGRECATKPRWVDVCAPGPSAPRLCIPEATREPLGDAILEAVRKKQFLTTSAVHERYGDRVLPANLRVRLPFTIGLLARARDEEFVSEALRAELDGTRLALEETVIVVTKAWLGTIWTMHLHLSRLRADPKPELLAKVTVDDGRGVRHEFDAVYEADIVTDGGSAVVVALARRDQLPAATFPGRGAYSSIDASSPGGTIATTGEDEL